MEDKAPFILHNQWHGHLARYVKFGVAPAPGMPGTFSPLTRVSDPDVHHSTCVTFVSWCMSGWLTSGFLWSQWRGKRSRPSRRMRNPQFYVSGKRLMAADGLASQRGKHSYPYYWSRVGVTKPTFSVPLFSWSWKQQLVIKYHAIHIWNCSLPAVPPVKYQCGSDNITDPPAKSKISYINKTKL